MLKKFLATATAAVMAMSLVACGSSGSSASSNDVPAQTKAEEQGQRQGEIRQEKKQRTVPGQRATRSA